MAADGYTEKIIDSFHPLIVATKNKCKVKKWSKH